jgi:DnaK suppressor protein
MICRFSPDATTVAIGLFSGYGGIGVMAGQNMISSQQLEEFRGRLRELRDGLIDQVDRSVEAIRGDLNPAGNLSNAPIHLADAAPGQMDADISIIENERDMLQNVQDALHRIDNGHFGQCVQCGSAIAAGRLELLPYTPYCIHCANQQSGQSEPAPSRGGGTMRLTGFGAIEFAEKEGLKLNKLGDSIDEAAEGLSIAEAEAIASDNPDLIWLEIASDEYGVRKNMRPGR